MNGLRKLDGAPETQSQVRLKFFNKKKMKSIQMNQTKQVYSVTAKTE